MAFFAYFLTFWGFLSGQMLILSFCHIFLYFRNLQLKKAVFIAFFAPVQTTHPLTPYKRKKTPFFTN